MAPRISRSGRSTWLTRPCGCAYWTHSRRKLCIHDVRFIRSKRNQGRMTRVEMAHRVGVHPTAITHIIHFKWWRNT